MNYINLKAKKKPTSLAFPCTALSSAANAFLARKNAARQICSRIEYE